MITWLRSGYHRDGKRMEALEWALKVSAYVNEKFGLNVSVQVNVAGPLNQIHWLATHESMADFEEVSMKVIEDAGYQQMVAAANEQELFDGSSLADSFYRQIG